MESLKKRWKAKTPKFWKAGVTAALSQLTVENKEDIQ